MIVKHKKSWFRDSERWPLAVAWLQLAAVWLLAYVASQTPPALQAKNHALAILTDMVALTSFAQFLSGVFYLFVYPYTSLRKRLLVSTALFFSLVVIIATKQGVVRGYITP